jgi:FkbM family methyltransferase
MANAVGGQVGSGGASVNRAENDVDIRVRNRFFLDTPSGVVVEIGAARPDFLSISALYRSLGWQVFSIEPNPAYKPLYDARGYEMLQYACGDHDEDDVPFSVVDSHQTEYRGGEISYESFSSLGIKASYGGGVGVDVIPIKVRLRRLDTILREHGPEVSRVDLVCIDVEGWELEALSGFSFDRYKPQVLIVENLFFEAKYRSFMKVRGFVLWRRFGPNDVYAQATLVGFSDRLISFAQTFPQTVYGRTRSLIRMLVKPGLAGK